MDETYFAFYDKLEPFTDSELHALGITKQPVVIKEIDHEEVEETITDKVELNVLLKQRSKELQSLIS